MATDGGSPVSIVKSKVRTCRRDIIFYEEYVQEIVNISSYNLWPRSMIGGICFDAFNESSEGDSNAFVGTTYGNWANEAPSKLEDFMPQNNDSIDSHDYIDLKFEIKMYPIRISIFEKFHPGTVVRVWAWDELTKNWQKLWSGLPQACPNKNRIFTPPLAICKFKTDIIRLELNYSLADYYTQLDGALLFGTENLVLPKEDIQDHRLINVIPTRYDAKCAIPEKAKDIHNLTRHILEEDAFLSDLKNIKSIIRRSYVIWTNDKVRLTNSPSGQVKTIRRRKQRSLNDFPVRNHDEQ